MKPVRQRNPWTVFFLVFGLCSFVGYSFVNMTESQRRKEARLEANAKFEAESRSLRAEARKLAQLETAEIQNLEREHQLQINLLNTAYEQIGQTLKAEQELEIEALARGYQSSSLQLQTAQYQKLDQLRGSPMDWATKNPSNNIQHMLLQLAKLAAPSNTEVLVMVDRFSEFSLFLRFPSRSHSNQIPTITRSILSRASPFVSQIQFSSTNDPTILAQIDNQDIQKVSDWNTAPNSTLQALLRQDPHLSSSSATNNSDQQNSELEQDSDIESAAGLAKVLANHRDLSRRAIQTINNALTLHRKAARLENITIASAASDLDSQIDAQYNALQSIKPNLSNSSFDSFQILLHEGYSREFSTIVARELNKNLTAMHSAVEAVMRHAEVTMDYLAVMKQFRGSWNPVPQTTQIRFTSASASDAYSKVTEQLVRALNQVESALKEINNRP